MRESSHRCSEQEVPVLPSQRRCQGISLPERAPFAFVHLFSVQYTTDEVFPLMGGLI